MSLRTGTFTDAEVKHSIYTLAEKAEVRGPDTKESPGANFLSRVQNSANDFDADALLEGIRSFIAEGNDADDYGVNDLPDDVRDSLWEAADGDVQIYTYQCWQEFVDLCLYEEDISDLSLPEEGDLTKIAMITQAVVAERLLGVLLVDRSVLLHEANPEDPFPHEDADNDVLHLEEASDSSDLHVHLAYAHGVDLGRVAPGTDLDTLHRTLDHSDLADS